MDNRIPSATESLELITRMIGETRKQVEKSSHRPFLVMMVIPGHIMQYQQSKNQSHV